MTALPVTEATRFERERRWLGYAGLAPFLAGLGMLVIDAGPGGNDVVAQALTGYAAVIASFLGAVHWGLAENGKSGRIARLRWGVTPALVAWVLLALPPAAALTGFAALYALLLVVDRHLLPAPAADYRRLRLRLTTIVVATLLAAAALVARNAIPT